MGPQANTLIVVLAALGLCLKVSIARADAVPPPPKSCPKGHVGTTSHGGPKCVLEAPKNCAPGYRGALGGKCVLATCSSDEQCKDGRRCLSVDTCQEFRELHWSGWGWVSQRPVSRDNFLAGPPRPRPDGPAKKAWVSLSICGQDGPCKAPAECRPESLCYPPSAIGKTKAKVATSGVPEGPATPDSSASSDTTGAGGAVTVGDVTNGAGRSKPGGPVLGTPTSDSDGGCRKGCSAASAPSLTGWAGIPVLACVGLLRRRRRAAIRSRR